MNTIILAVLAWIPSTAPSLTCDQPNLDLGEIRGGPPIRKSFTVTNRDSKEIRIVHVQPSCGCLVSSIAGRVLKPGESTRVDVTIATISQPAGANLWSARLFVRAGDSTEDQLLDLHVRAKVVREVSLEPAALRLSGRPGLSHEMTLTDRREKPLAIQGISASSAGIDAALQGDWVKSEAGWKRTLRIAITDKCAKGRHEEFVQIFSDDPDYREFRVTVAVTRK